MGNQTIGNHENLLLVSLDTIGFTMARTSAEGPDQPEY